MEAERIVREEVRRVLRTEGGISGGYMLREPGVRVALSEDEARLVVDAIRSLNPADLGMSRYRRARELASRINGRLRQ